MQRLFLFLFYIILLAACDCSYQYSVYVVNDTGEQIKVAYKSENDVRGTIEETISVPHGEMRQIINTINLYTGGNCIGAKAEDCEEVAEYVHAFMRDSIDSNLKWCQESVEFLRSDIQQGEFTLRYTRRDFPLSE